MANLNKMLAMGNLTRNPDLKTTKQGSNVCELTIALNRSKNEVCFIDVVLWGKLAENSARYLTKGSNVLVEGYLKQEQRETKDGKKYSQIKLVAETIQFLSKLNQEPSQAPNGDYGDYNNQPPQAQAKPKQKPTFYGLAPAEQDTQENIPF